jgi:hypothetical protein
MTGREVFLIIITVPENFREVPGARPFSLNLKENTRKKEG